jgi:glycerol uptake facilitator
VSTVSPPLAARCGAELLGTFLLVFFGCGSVHAAVLMGAQAGVWQVAIVWGVAVMVACFLVGGISGSHINPAITLTVALWRGFPPGLVVPYLLSQMAGAVFAALALFALYAPYLDERERALGVTRGEPGSEMTAMCYGEYFPSPGGLAGAWEKQRQDGEDSAASLLALRTAHYDRFHPAAAFLGEFLGTLILALVVFGLTDPHNAAVPLGRLAPVFIGLTVAILISVFGPLTQACFNPARDFGPRLVAACTGWGSIAFPGPNGWGCLLVYLVAPITGALVGGGLYERVLKAVQPREGPDVPGREPISAQEPDA